MKRNVSEDEFLKKRKLRQRKIRRRRIKISLVFLLIAAIATVAVLSVTVFFKIEVLRAEGSEKYSSDRIIGACGIEIGDNLLISSVDEESLKNALPYIEKISLVRRLPGSLTIKVSDAKPYICFYTEEKYYPVSREGRLLDCLDEAPSGIPTVYAGLVKPQVGRLAELTDEENGGLIKRIFEVAGDKGITIDDIDVTEPLAIGLVAENRFEVTLGTSNYIENKLAHLGGMIKSMDASAEGKIDLSMWTPDNTEGTFVSTSEK